MNTRKRIVRADRHPTRILVLTSLLCALWTLSRTAAAPVFLDEPFKVSVAMSTHQDGRAAVVVRFEPAPDHYLYAEEIQVRIPDGDGTLEAHEPPDPVRKPDPELGTIMAFYDRTVQLIYPLPATLTPTQIEISFLGCNPVACYPPETLRFTLPSGTPIPEDAQWEASPAETMFANLKERSRETGFLRVEAFHAFLDSGLPGGEPRRDTLRAAYDRGAVGLLIVLILLGGLALNLTPCVLPMIPVNLAVIGAGARSNSRRRGLTLGLIYGLGITLAYGALGVAAVVLRAQFGALNASWIFNLAITTIFVLLALAMFDVFLIDLSRFQPKTGAPSGRRAGVGMAFGFGALSALLAGACVAPVVISVLLLASEIQARSTVLGILLPFLLGAGMALPWPFAGAGLSLLPKPGAWMNKVKTVFGVLILLLAAYYGRQTWNLAAQEWGRQQADAGNIQRESKAIRSAADQARRENKPLVLDFWATWCRSCLAMDRSTFMDESIRQRLDRDFVFLKVQAEQPNDPATRDLLRRFDVRGLPTYVILTAEH